MSQSQSSDYDGEWSRVRRQAEDVSSTTTSTTSTASAEEEKPARILPKYALYNATGEIW